MPMDKKQTLLMVLTIIAFLFLGYEIYRLVTDDTSTPVAAKTTVLPAKASPTKAANSTDTASTSEANAPVQLASLQQQPASVKNQQAYMQLMNQYEIAKMRRQLVDEEVAIAQAQHRIQELSGGASASTASDSLPNSTSFTPAQSGIQLSYLDKQDGQWSATINNNGQYVQVTKGSMIDGRFKVIGVDQDGVLVQAAAGREQITFNGIKAIKAPVVVKKQVKKVEPKVVVKPAKKPAEKVALIKPLPKPAKTVAVVVKPAIVATKKSELPFLVAKPTIIKKAKPVPVTHPVLSKELQATLPGYVAKPPAMPAKKTPMPLPTAFHRLLTQPTNMLDVSRSKTLVHKAAVEAPDAKPLTGYLVHFNKAKKAKKKAKHPAVPQLTADEKQLLAMGEHDYSIQLIASHHKKTVQDFARQQMLGYKTYIYHVVSNGKPWYMLLYGDYKTWSDARQALVSMPPHIQVQGPWIRQLSMVQQDLRQHSKKTVSN